MSMFISSAYAQTAPAAASGGDGLLGGLTGNLGSFLPLVLMFVALYFIMIRPQMKKQKEQKAMLDALAKGDEVATAGGIIGTITKLNDSIVTLEIASGVEMQVQRFAVAQVLPKGTRS